jgi:hypothetical protein
MRNTMKRQGLLASTALAAALAVFGCTTNKMPGNGQPTSQPLSSPAVPAPTNGTSGGTVPMISAGPASMTTPAVEALATVAAREGFRGRVLGTVNPEGRDPYAGQALPPTGQVRDVNAVLGNPETVNSTIFSGPNPAITSGAGEGGGVAIVSGGGAVTSGAALTSAPTNVSGAVTASPITAANTATSANSGVTTSSLLAAAVNTAAAPNAVNAAAAAAPIFATPTTIATPTNTASTLTTGAFAAGPGATGNNTTGTLTPTVSSAAVPSPTVAANPASRPARLPRQRRVPRRHPEPLAIS